eukprot:m.133832 g.133832  ORF g.133832 m.133832 type:complete len:251 (-) comp9493_c0_seq6:1277-2029(-)
MSCRFVEIDLEEEFAILSNDGDESMDLKGYVIGDMVGSNTCHPLESFVIPPHERVTFWTAPMKKEGLEENEKNIFWRNKNGKPRTRTVLNNEGDGLRLINPKGVTIAQLFVAHKQTASAPLLVVDNDAHVSYVGSPSQEKRSQANSQEDYNNANIYDDDDDTNDMDDAEDDTVEEFHVIDDDVREEGSSTNSNAPVSSANASFQMRSNPQEDDQVINGNKGNDPTQDLYDNFCNELDSIETSILAKYCVA